MSFHVQPPLGPGIYFDLDEDRYHRDPALGSSNIRALLRSAPDFWWESPFNPMRPADKTTEARIRGRAMHVLAFYGKHRFDKQFKRRPDDPPNASSTTKTAVTKLAKADLSPGQFLIDGDAYDRVLVSGKMIDANPEFGGTFDGGFAEVSIFWERDGIMRKARFDYFKPRGVGDLKSITNTRGEDFEEACRYAINRYRYPIQAAQYLEARSMVPALVLAGKVFSLPKGKENKQLLEEIADEKEFAFQWVFFQSDGAPNVWGKILSPSNPVTDISMIWIEKAVDRYKKYLAQFGPNKLWVMAEKPTELDQSEMWKSYMEPV